MSNNRSKSLNFTFCSCIDTIVTSKVEHTRILRLNTTLTRDGSDMPVQSCSFARAFASCMHKVLK